MSAAKILLVEDDRESREAIGEVLEDEGYEVVSTTDGLAALAQLRGPGTLPALILIDYSMPKMNALHFRTEMLKEPAWKDIKLVLLTADIDPQGKSEAVQATGFLRKPVSIEDLCSVVRSVIDGP
ncbi:MAG: response regulator [Myxococcaceae bacterium]